ncbi:hypothetical protein KUG85_04680 [Nitratireductor sp. L1-7-SE]|uniref:Right-handed parallel beta-helix repeat-containing protein n=1 Tax=Nitratireductor rhodophyticola TaxID=2854036 RepID=A0ABS7RFT8_9HYPH|nr:hypothetical protein [Nitratireductor rhodophyticola]MBY8918831.1 hypothetical protein [Nitratireductor rhodophyticola]MBY8919986.1 hypothetical protein [Nitratireductor rhodophyticola]
MTLFTKLGVDIAAPADAAGNPRNVVNGEMQTWMTEVEKVIDLAVTGGDLLVFDSLAALDGDLDHPANTGAILIGESIADDGLYMKQGASGSGSWVKVGNVPGQGFVKATNAGTGTANAIEATTPVAVNETQLILLPIVAENTGSPVTVAFNGATSLTVKTVAGNDVSVAGLPASSVMLGVIQGSNFRLLSDQASAAIQAAAEAAQVAAEAALSEMREKSAGPFPDDAAADAFLAGEGLTKQPGTIYFNTASDVWRYWDGSAWQTFPYATVADGAITTSKLSDGAVSTSKLADEGITRGKLSAELSQAIASTPMLFGASGGGLVDDASAINTAIASLPAGGVLDGLGKTYRVDSTLALKANIKIRNLVLDFSNAANGDKLFEASGTMGGDLALSSDATTGASSVSLSSVAGLAENDYLWISSDGEWCALDGTTFGEMVRVKSIAGSVVTLTAPLAYSYTIADNAKVNRLNFLEDIELEAVEAFGSGVAGEQYAADLTLLSGLTITGCRFADFDDRALMIGRTAHVNIHRTRCERALRAGLAYGVAIVNGCHWVNITECSFERVRHGVTIGGTDGVNRHITVQNNNAFGSVEAGFDCHPAGDHINFIDNYIFVDGAVTVDGIIVQGGNAEITGNTVRGAKRYGVFHQVLSDFGAVTSIVSGNDVAGAAGNYGVFVNAQGASVIESVIINGNTIRDYVGGIFLRAQTAIINSFSIVGNSYYESSAGTTQAIKVESQSTNTCNDGVISANSGRVAAGGTGIYLVAATAGYIQYVAVSGNSIRGGAYGCRGVNTNRINTNGNVFYGTTTAGVSVAGAESIEGGNLT